jgi:hypothetical protein
MVETGPLFVAQQSGAYSCLLQYVVPRCLRWPTAKRQLFAASLGTDVLISRSRGSSIWGPATVSEAECAPCVMLIRNTVA